MAWRRSDLQKDSLTCDEVAKGLNDAIQAADLINAGFGVLGDPSQWGHGELQITYLVSDLMSLCRTALHLQAKSTKDSPDVLHVTLQTGGIRQMFCGHLQFALAAILEDELCPGFVASWLAWHRTRVDPKHQIICYTTRCREYCAAQLETT